MDGSSNQFSCGGGDEKWSYSGFSFYLKKNLFNLSIYLNKKKKQFTHFSHSHPPPLFATTNLLSVSMDFFFRLREI